MAARPQQDPPGQGPNSVRRWGVVQDLAAGALLVSALFLPWNLYFGLRIPGSSQYLFAVLLLVTLLSLIAAALPHAARPNPTLAGRLRLGLNIPYLLLISALVVYDMVQTIRLGGTIQVPGGIGPGGWLGIAGALLSAQPLITGAIAADDRYRGWFLAARIIGYASMFGAALSAGFTLSWRVRYALQPSGSGFGKQNIAVIDTAVVYGVVALVAVLVASRWILKGTEESRLSTIGLGASTLVAGIVVWSLPVGREIDAFHGIAQNTSTAGVGFEGYLAWAAAAAIFAPLTLLRSSSTRLTDRDRWRAAARNGLLLIVVWCLGSVLMRLTDLLTAVLLNYPFSRYDTMTLAAFDLVTGVLAIWLRINLSNDALPGRLIWSLCGLVFTLTIARVIVGVVLAPRFEESPGVTANPVYGNNLAQQITSTFDVTLCGLALSILAAVIVSRRLRPPGQRRRHPRRRRPAVPAVPAEAKTTQFPTAPTGHDAPTTVLTGSTGSPRIFRSAESTGPVRPKIYRPPGNSS
ncbi:DUF7937 domain-containing protein [Mycobacterium simiae]|uniref:DUF7937 domain-containing protein n=1 Tax=Mycobacterium simiae TaxID=1784 RepID=UPI0021CD455D|nr:hypothetical protein [Mycobacterium simiae]